MKFKNVFSATNQGETINPRLILFALALSGGASLIYEVVGSEILYFNFSSNFHSTSTVLSVFLLGMAIGSLCVSRLFHKFSNKRLLFVIFQSIIAIYAILVLTNFDLVTIISRFLSGSQPINSLFIKSIIEFFSGVIFLILPTFLCGACFPLAVSIATKQNEDVGKKVGSLYSWDMFGAVIGTIVSGFFLISHFGLKITLVFAAALNFLACILVIPKRKQKVIVFISAVILITIFLIPNWGPNRYLDVGSGRFNIGKIDKILFRKPSSYGLVSVMEKTDSKFLVIDTNFACYSEKNPTPDIRSEQRISEIVLEILDKNKTKPPVRVLNIGLGCGFTLDYLRKSDRVTSLDVAEINPVIPQATKFFAKENNNVLDDPRVNVIIKDGFEFLKTNKEKYDAIVVDIESPLIFHSSPLYTLEFFKEVSNNLKENGVFALWGYSAFDEKRSKILFDTQQTVFNFVYPLIFQPDQLFFSSNQEMTLMNEIMDQDSKGLYTRLLQSKTTEINSLNNPILKTYFKSY